MRIKHLKILNFRGYEDFSLQCPPNVVLIGEPGSGRSDIATAIDRVLNADSTRSAADIRDLHCGSTEAAAVVEVTLGDLGSILERSFERQLEPWDVEADEVILDAEEAGDITSEQYEWILRIAYTIRWQEQEDRAEHWTYFPKTSDPAHERWDRVRRVDRLALPYVNAQASRPLQIRPEGQFRKLLETLDSDGSLAAALNEVASDVEDLTARLSNHPAVIAGLDAVLQPLRTVIQIDEPPAPPDSVVRFSPNGGALAGLLRALGPSVDRQDDVGFLPLTEHGSTLSELLAVSEAMALADTPSAVIVFDDLGDRLDGASSEYLAGLLRRSSGQCWATTRRPEVARQFEPSEIVRLTGRGRTRRAHVVGQGIGSNALVRHLNALLMPAMTGRALILCEGQHDALSLNAIAQAMSAESNFLVPAAYGARMIDSSGITEIPKLAQLATSLGFRVISVLDHDKPGPETEARLAAVIAESAGVVRLPQGFAIERALTHGVDPANLRHSMRTIRDDFGLPWPDEAGLSDEQVRTHLASNMKARGGLHLAFIRALPTSAMPPVGVQLLAETIRLVKESGSRFVQLSTGES